MNDSATANILIVDDSPDIIQLMGRMLAGLGKLRFATSGEAALAQVGQAAPDLILLDAEMPGMDGFAVCRALKANPAHAGIPVIFVTAHGGTDVELRCLEAGAADFLFKPVNPPVLLARARTQLRVRQLSEELRRVAALDTLTKLPNCHSFSEALERECQRCARAGVPLSLLRVDIDHFRLFNEHHGHAAGDACLQAVAGALRLALLRAGDMAARFGADEFALLLPDTPGAGAMQMSERVRELIASLDLQPQTSPGSSRLTVSIGAACYQPADEAARQRGSAGTPVDAERLLRCAKAALRQARQSGGDTARGLALDAFERSLPALAEAISSS